MPHPAGTPSTGPSNSAARKRTFPSISSGRDVIRPRTASVLPQPITEIEVQAAPPMQQNQMSGTIEIPPVPGSVPAIGAMEISSLLGMTDEQLKKIYNDAPESLKQGFTLNRSKPLETVLQMRDALRSSVENHLEQADRDDPNRSFSMVMEMTPTELLEMTKDRPRELDNLLRAARQSHHTLPDLRDASSDAGTMGLLATALAWKFNAVNDLLEIEEEKTEKLQIEIDNVVINNRQLRTGQGTVSAPSGSLLEANVSAMQIGGVTLSGPPLPPIDGLDFQTGRRSALRLPSQLPQYPTHGTSPILLAVSEIIGPSILYNFIKHGLNVEQYVRTRPCWQNGQHPEQIELEALTLARALHLTLMQYPSPAVAIMSCPWMEVVLRRLYTVLKVEETHAKNPQHTRAVIWEGYKPSLETQRDDGLIVPVLENTRMQHIAAETRTNAAMLRMTPTPRPGSTPSVRSRKRNNYSRRYGDTLAKENLSEPKSQL